MEPAVDPFHPLLRIIERYRSDVHYLRPPPGDASISTIQTHLGRELPSTLLTFLSRWNGATLFRGALRVRSVADLAPPNPDVPEVVLFADGPGEEDRWGFAETPYGHHFGRWDGERLVPLHEHFNRWLYGQARVLDENRRDEAEKARVRLEVDPENGLLVFGEGERLLAEGDGDGALRQFRRATALHPNHALAWQRLGEALLAVDRAGATHALLMALRSTSLPTPYPGAPIAERSLFRALEGLFPTGDAGWERELVHFLSERCPDSRHVDGADLMEAAGLALVRCRLTNGDRIGARAALVDLRQRIAGFTLPPDLPALTLALVSLHTDLGEHDEAEEILRRLRRHSDAVVRARGELALARIALNREEPWVEDIARGALENLKANEDRCDALLLLAEHHDAAALEEAKRLAAQLGDPVREAKVTLLVGDACRAAGDLPAANQHYLACGADPETNLRGKLRLGDLAGDSADAMPFYVDAVDGYKHLQLPLREAWARLRLVRCGDASQAEQAHRLFKTAGLAAGVAAADALMSRQSLDWHITMCADHARQRYDAQRMRPPMVRADADRPERRILAHRSAIAGGDRAVVAALEADVLGELRKIQASDGRARDPAAMRFVGGIDLLSGHPSWEAAQVLLALLNEDVHQDVAARALIGAMARSPNMTLVAGLLQALETMTEPLALAMVVEAVGWRREQAAVPRLRVLAVEGSIPLRRAAITALGRIGDIDAIDLILPAMDLPELAEEASIALLLLGEWRGVDFHGQALGRDLPVLNRNSGEIVGRYGGTGYLLLLTRIAERDGPAALGALAGLGLCGSTRVIPILIAMLADRDPTRQQVANTALELITGHKEDLEESHARTRWETWWAETGPKFRDDVRYRHGAPLTVRALIDRLGHDDPTARQVAYDELVIATGCRLPFDVDGPWRVQLAHRAAWSRWYADAAHTLPEGGWMFGGEDVG